MYYYIICIIVCILIEVAQRLLIDIDIDVLLVHYRTTLP